MNTKKHQPARNQKMIDWLNKMTRPSQKAMAYQMATSIGQLRQIAYGKRPCNTRLAILIDRWSGGQITMSELAPELDWNYVKVVIPNREVSVDENSVSAGAGSP